MARIKNRKRSRAELYNENAKLKAEVLRLQNLKEPQPPTEAELDERRSRLIAELCDMANSLTADDYEPDKLAAIIEAEEREMGTE